jgi:hypothetical protein
VKMGEINSPGVTNGGFGDSGQREPECGVPFRKDLNQARSQRWLASMLYHQCL